jgi:hypothetical protein
MATRRLAFLIVLAWLSVMGPMALTATTSGERLVQEWEPDPSSDGIDLAYRCLFMIYYDTAHRSYEAQTKALRCADILCSRQREEGVVMRYGEGGNVNDKLMTSIATWALAAAYGYSGDERYAEAARRGADFLIGEMERWESTYPSGCDDPHADSARNAGEGETCLTSYCWTSPNDLGIVSAAIGSLAYYGIGDGRYRLACTWLADALYEMQLADGSWYDGYAKRYPTRWDRSCHYVSMAMMGPWMAYNITGEERYRTSLEEAWEWLVAMQGNDGAVYDIWVDDVNMHKAQRTAHPHDFTQVDGQTDVKRYHASPRTTYLGEFSLAFSASMLEQLGLDADEVDATRSYLDGRVSFSNWYLLSQVLPSGMGGARIRASEKHDVRVAGHVEPCPDMSPWVPRPVALVLIVIAGLAIAAAMGVRMNRRS